MPTTTCLLIYLLSLSFSCFLSSSFVWMDAIRVALWMRKSILERAGWIFCASPFVDPSMTSWSRCCCCCGCHHCRLLPDGPYASAPPMFGDWYSVSFWFHPLGWHMASPYPFHCGMNPSNNCRWDDHEPNFKEAFFFTTRTHYGVSQSLHHPLYIIIHSNWQFFRTVYVPTPQRERLFSWEERNVHKPHHPEWVQPCWNHREALLHPCHQSHHLIWVVQRERKRVLDAMIPAIFSMLSTKQIIQCPSSTWHDMTWHDMTYHPYHHIVVHALNNAKRQHPQDHSALSSIQRPFECLPW